MTLSSSTSSAAPQEQPRRGLLPTLRRTGRQAGIALLGEDRFMEARAALHMAMDRRRHKPLFIVHTMGKVGSTTVDVSLKAHGLEESMAVHQRHFLTEEGAAFVEDLSIEGVGSWEKLPANDRSFLLSSRLLYKDMQKRRAAGERVKIVSMVRDPVATNLSGFFHNYIWWPEEIKARCVEPSDDCLEALQCRFLEHYPHEVPAIWFDIEIRPLYGVDVFATPFDRDLGYAIYHSDFADILLLKLEKLNQCAAPAFYEFMGLDGFELLESNKAEDKSYASLYKAFRKRTTLPESYLDRVYVSRMAHHFYTDGELAAFRQKWLA